MMDRQSPHVSRQLISIVQQASLRQFDQETWIDNAMTKALTSISDFGTGKYGFRELTLRQMLCDPIVQDLMRADKVSIPDVLNAYDFVGQRRIVLAA